MFRIRNNTMSIRCCVQSKENISLQMMQLISTDKDVMFYVCITWIITHYRVNWIKFSVEVRNGRIDLILLTIQITVSTRIFHHCTISTYNAENRFSLCNFSFVTTQSHGALGPKKKKNNVWQQNQLISRTVSKYAVELDSFWLHKWNEWNSISANSVTHWSVEMHHKHFQRTSPKTRERRKKKGRRRRFTNMAEITVKQMDWNQAWQRGNNEGQRSPERYCKDLSAALRLIVCARVWTPMGGSCTCKYHSKTLAKMGSMDTHTQME